MQQSSESILDQSILSNELEVAETNPNVELSTPDRPSGPLLEEQFSAPLPNDNPSLDTDVNEIDAEVADFIAKIECDSSEDITVYEVVTELQATSTVPATNYPHIFLQLSDGHIINVERGDVIISLSQFVAPSEATEPGEIKNDSTFSSESSPRPLNIDSEYVTSTQEGNNRNPNDDTLSTSCEQSSQTFLAHEEIGIADSTMEDLEGEVVREVRSLILDPPQGWLETDSQMVYHTNESEWGSEGVPENAMRLIKQQHVCQIPTNADCIKYLYDYEEVDDPKVPDHIHYRRCMRPTTLEEVYRRWSFRIRRRSYFARPAMNIGGFWFPELYLPDAEDPEWSWKEGIEVDRPAQSLYQLNEGKVFGTHSSI